MSNSMSGAALNVPRMMRAVVQDAYGDADVMQVKEVEIPAVGEGEVLIKVAASGVNKPDLLQRMGKYPAPAGITNIMGLECSGEIVALGPNTTRYKVGDKVCALVAGGSYAEYVNAPEGQCLPVPAGLDMQSAAVLPECVFTVWSNLFEMGKLKAGDTALVHGGAGGIGTYAIQMGVAAGANILVTVSTPAKADACLKLGAALAINYKRSDFTKIAMDFTNQKGVNVVLDIIGADYVPRNLAAMAYAGRHVSISTNHGQVAVVNIRDVMIGRLMLTGSILRPRSAAEKTRLAAELEAHVWPWIAEGKVKPLIYQSFPLEKVADAHKAMESGEHIGKIVLTMR